MLIDTHCHLDYSQYENLDDVIGNILNSGIEKIIVSGCDIGSSNEAIALAHKYESVFATVGFHPHECVNVGDNDYKMFDSWLNDSKVIAVGEIGLDYHYDVDKDKQFEILNKQIDIAIKYNKPIVVHNREASEDIYNILKNKNVRGVIHCFNDDASWARKFIDLGFFLGIGGIITFKNNNLKNVIANIPLEYIVLETDSPYLSPEPLRGRLNSPANLPLIANEVAKIKGIAYDEVAAITTQNAVRLFDL